MTVNPFGSFPEFELLRRPPPRDLALAGALLRRSGRSYLIAWVGLAASAAVLTAIILNLPGQRSPDPLFLLILYVVLGFFGWLAWFVARARARVVTKLLRDGHLIEGRVTHVNSGSSLNAARFTVDVQPPGGPTRHILVEHSAGAGLYGVGSSVLVFAGDAAPGRAAVVVRMGAKGDRLQAFAGRFRA